ncbi:MAG: MFS transporter [Hyphomicrobiaceae bacterium]
MAKVETASELDTETFVSWREFLSSSHAPSLILVSLAVWLHAADSLIVATMLPAIVATVGGAALVGWSISLYEIGSIVAGAASALLTMRYGLRGPMSCAAVLFGLGCVVSAVGSTMPQILVGRALQGLGGGGLVAMALVAVGVIFPRRYTARAMAVVSTFWGASAFTGPLIGGFFVEYATWRWGFVFFALQAFGLALWIILRRDAGLARASTVAPVFPLRRLAVLCLAVILVASGGIEISLMRTATLVACGLICLSVFLWLDGRAGENRLLPLFPYDIRRATGAALILVMSLTIASIAILAFGPLLVTAIHNASALIAGYIIACSSVGWTIMALLVSGSPERFDRAMIALGTMLVTLSVVGFVYAVPNGPIWLIAAFAAMEGGGFGMAWTFILRRTTALADKSDVQRISGAIPTVQRLGYALGAAYVGIIANASGLVAMESPAAAADVAYLVFVACLPFAILAVIAMAALVLMPTEEEFPYN